MVATGGHGLCSSTRFAGPATARATQHAEGKGSEARACTWPPGLEASAIGIAATRAARSLSASSRQRTCPPVHHLTSSNAKSRLDRSPARTRGRGAEQQARGRARQGRGPAVGLGPGRRRTRPSGARRRTERPRGHRTCSGTRGAVGGGRRHGGRRCDGKGLREILPCGQPTGERGTAQNRRCELQAAVANSGTRGPPPGCSPFEMSTHGC